MKIGIELRQVTLGHSGGISQLLQNVLETLFTLHPEQDYVFFSTIFNRGLLERLPNRAEVVTLPLDRYHEELARLAVEKQIDVLFRGYPMESELTFPLSRQVFEIPDIQHEYFPEFFTTEALRSRRVAFTRALKAAGAIATLTEFTRGTLQEQPCNRCADVFLMSPALPTRHANDAGLTDAESALVPAGDFFLYPANLWPHKNHRRVLKAFARFLERTGRPAELILTGHPAGWEKLHKQFSTLPVRHLGFVRPTLLRHLFLKTKALVFFSLYEGFGMPLLEAFDAGAPVVCGNTTALPEVGGDAALSCDPTDIEAMSGLMERVGADEKLRADLIAKGKQRLKAYTWEQAAQNLFDALERVARRATAAPATLPAVVKGTAPPLVSIVTPSFNQGRFLRRTIDSVLNQTYPHVEYRVMDGGSTDDSVAILKSYGGRFSWVSQRDGGQTNAINTGLAQARGEIQAYLNSDDVLLPDAAARAVHHFTHRPDCDMVYGLAHHIDKDDGFLDWYPTADYSLKRLLLDCCVCQPAAFWRAAIARKIGPFDESLHYAMDLDYWLRIDRAGGRIEHLGEVLASTRIHEDAKTLSCHIPVHKEIIRAYERHVGRVDPHYVLGLWIHLCESPKRPLLHSLGRVRGFTRSIGFLHCTWLNRYSARGLLSVARRALCKLAWRCGDGVVGFHLDNWLAPVFSVSLTQGRAEQTFYLSGVAPVDLTVTAALDDRDVHTASLRAGRYETIRVTAAPGAGRLSLRFSAHALRGPSAGPVSFLLPETMRPVSFLLQETNLFTEQDVA
jgi:glycosyltransferase involved in cell wall biosynthesis/GT2 family glycosyltransferase